MPSFGADEQTLALQVCPKPEGHATALSIDIITLRDTCLLGPSVPYSLGLRMRACHLGILLCSRVCQYTTLQPPFLQCSLGMKVKARLTGVVHAAGPANAAAAAFDSFAGCCALQDLVPVVTPPGCGPRMPAGACTLADPPTQAAAQACCLSCMRHVCTCEPLGSQPAAETL